MQQTCKAILLGAAFSLTSTFVFAQTDVLTAYICYGETVKIRARSPDAVSYEWYRNGELIAGVSGDSCIAASGGVYSVAAVGSNGCTSMATDMVYIVQHLPLANDDAAFAGRSAATAIYVLNNDSSFCAPIDSSTLNAVVLPSKGTVRSEAGIMYYLPYTLESGIDTFTYHFADKDGTYSNEAKVTVTISNSPGVILYPNPTDDDVNITILDERITAWRLIDVHGRVFMENPVTSKNQKIDISHLAAAPYFFTFFTDNKMVYNVKVIKR